MRLSTHIWAHMVRVKTSLPGPPPTLMPAVKEHLSFTCLPSYGLAYAYLVMG